MSDEVEIDVEFPSNSHKTSEKKEKTVEKVTINEVVEAKPGIGSLFKEIFSPSNLKGIVGFVAVSVIVPAVKSMIYEAGTKGLERAMWGDEPSRPNTSRGPVNYSVISTNKSYGRRPNYEPPTSKTNLNNLVIQTRGEAETILDHLGMLIEQYGHATVADYYQLVGKTGSYTDNKWGWTSLRGARVERDFHGGYGISLPQAEPV